MRLSCPICGERDLREFVFRGADLDRPEGAWGDDWDAYLHLRDNPAGPSREQWFHRPCGRWLVVHRNTVSHEVLSVDLAMGTAT